MDKVDKIWKTFEEAKKVLAYSDSEFYNSSGKFKFICHCIEHVHGVAENGSRLIRYTSEVHPVLIASLDVISSRLEGNLTLPDWLAMYVPSKDRWDDLANNDGRKLQATRHAWLDSLIEEYKAKDE